MALDTATKRFAMLCASSPVGGHLVVPDGSFGKTNRFAMLHIFGGNVITIIATLISNAGVIGGNIIGKDTM